MSRGLSRQQRAILGLGVRINRAVNLGEVVPIDGEPEADAGWKPPVLYSPGLAEVALRYVMHLLHGVPIEDEGYRPRDTFFAHNPRTLSLKASTARAVASLVDRGHLAIRPGLREWPGRGE